MINIKRNLINIIMLIVLPWVFLLLYYKFGDLTGYLDADFEKYSFLAVFILIFGGIVFLFFTKILIVLSVLTLLYTIAATIIYKTNIEKREKYVDLMCVSYVCVFLVDVAVCLVTLVMLNIYWVGFSVLYSVLLIKSKKRFEFESNYRYPY